MQGGGKGCGGGGEGVGGGGRGVGVGGAERGGLKFDLDVKRSKINLQSSFDETW